MIHRSARLARFPFTLFAANVTAASPRPDPSGEAMGLLGSRLRF